MNNQKVFQPHKGVEPRGQITVIKVVGFVLGSTLDIPQSLTS